MGAHTLKATATDLAGNTASVTQHYTVVKADQTISITAPGTAAFGDPNVTVSASSTSGLPVSLTAQGACSLDGTHLSMTGVGDCVLTGSQDGNDNYNPAQRTLTIDVGRGSQTLTIDAPQTATYGQADFPITVTASSGLPAAVVGSGACTVTDGTVHVIAAGACLISASQAGNDTYNPAPDVTRTIQVGKAAQSVRLDAPSRVTYGVGTFAITADASSGLKVALSADGACTISGGIVRVVGVGTCRIVATQGGNEDYQAAPTVVRNVTVDPAPLPATHVTVKGKVKVGKRLTAKLAIPAGATVRYQWLAGKKVIKGATKATLKLKKGLLGKKIKVRVTVSLDGYQTTTVVGVKAKKVKR